MYNSLTEILLRANTALFAQKVSDTLDLFFGTHFKLQAKSLFKGYYCSVGTQTVFMHFSGGIQGDFIITTEEEAGRDLLASIKDQDRTDEDPRKAISDYFAEILNISGGQIIPELEKNFGPLTMLPPNIVFGELRMAEVICGNVDITYEKYVLQCSLSLNLAGFSIADNLK